MGAAPHPQTETGNAFWTAPGSGWLDQIASHIRASGAHPARTVVLLPYAQLMPLAARLWAQRFPDGFAPRFETSQNWSRNLGDDAPGADDYRGDPALDALSARALLERAGLRQSAEATGPAEPAAALLLDSMHELAQRAAAMPPARRAEWAQNCRAAVLAALDTPALQLEARVAQVALLWAASSSYPTDQLYADSLMAEVDCLLVVPGLQPDALLQGLQACWGERLCVLTTPKTPAAWPGQQRFYPCRDAQDEAQLAAACVVRHVQAGRAPVALAVVDRALTRRVRAMLESQGVTMRDETGWKLSTTRAAAALMAALRALTWRASSDRVLDWLKHCPATDPQALQALEGQLRRHPQRLWRDVPRILPGLKPDQKKLLTTVLDQYQAWRAPMQSARPLAQWLVALRSLLQNSLQWEGLLSDQAGAQVIAALRLDGLQALPSEALWAPRRLSLQDFTHWVDQVLEAQSFKPANPATEQVVLLPLAQLAGREFAAVVLPGCDETRLSPSIEPAGVWTARQREVLGLPSRQTLESALRLAWLDGVQRPQVDILWRESEEGGEPLMPSPLVQSLQRSDPQQTSGQSADRVVVSGHQQTPEVSGRVVPTQGSTPAGQPDDLRASLSLPATPVQCPAPSAAQLSHMQISASAYQDLRHCPYRYFAMRLLGLREAEEIEGDLDKRDVGLWLHAVLQRFHETPGLDALDRGQRRDRLNAAADALAQDQLLAPEEFLPFKVAWPRLREGYLDWLAGHEAQGWVFLEGESELRQTFGQITLFGRLDRIDQDQDGRRMVLDYKTESRATTAERIKVPLEDTQLAFYAALQPADQVLAAYLSLSEREGTRVYEQQDVPALRQALLQGLHSDLQRIADGAPLPALGEGQVCETCAARGVCRKDFWSAA